MIETAKLNQILARLQYRASDAVAAISTRIGLVIVAFGVNHERYAVGIGEGIGAGTETRAADGKGRASASVRANLQIGEIALMRAVGIVPAVLLACRVPVRTGTFEFRSIALASRATCGSDRSR